MVFRTKVPRKVYLLLLPCLVLYFLAFPFSFGSAKQRDTSFPSPTSHLDEEANMPDLTIPTFDEHLAKFEPIEKPPTGGNFDVDENIFAGEQPRCCLTFRRQ